MIDVEQIKGVFEAHPLVAGDGEILCHGCHWVLGDPGRHLLQALLAVLDPHQTMQGPAETPQREDPRESRIVWWAS